MLSVGSQPQRPASASRPSGAIQKLRQCSRGQSAPTQSRIIAIGTLSATDEDDGQTLTFSVTGPEDATLTEGTFQWTPGNLAAYDEALEVEVTFAVTDSGDPALTDSKTVTLVVQNDDDEDGVGFLVCYSVYLETPLFGGLPLG